MNLPKAFQRFLNHRRFRQYYDARASVDLDGIGELRHEKFPEHAPQCWLDRPDAGSRIERRLKAGSITPEEADACRFWAANGYFIAPGLIPVSEIDTVWAAYETALAGGTFGPPRYADAAQRLHDRTLDAHLQIPEIRALLHHQAILRWTDLFFGRKTIPFQTIMGHAGSQQAAHSDSIHMTTYPKGFLSAAWIAFEDIDPGSGPLEYFPGSHKLPYLFSADIGIAEYEFKEKGYALYHERYEPAVQAACMRAGLEKRVFLPNKGDVLIWHANLTHGGALRTNPELSRKAMVCHYFGERTITYHDLSGNPSRLHKDGLYAPVERSPV
jgi:ectoine hydroxylase-related dioxygenase (phytanoyl-CoA dioxygenase family)